MRRTLVTLLAAGCCTVAVAQEKVVLANAGADHPMVETATRILTSAYGKLGMTVEVRVFSLLRSRVSADVGDVDGILFSGPDAAKQFKNLIRIDVPLGADDFMVFTKTVQLEVKGWESLRPYTIGEMSGMPEVNDPTAGMKVELVPKSQALFKKLDLGRTDVVVLPRTLGLMAIKSLGLRGIKMMPTPISSVKIFHYLNRKNQALATKLQAVLAGMKKDGTIDRLNRQREAELTGG